jgi:hypothetical protein
MKIQTPKSRKNTKSPACSTCKFMVADGDNGFCRRYPPSLKVDGISSGYVPVRADWICGEWKART